MNLIPNGRDLSESKARSGSKTERTRKYVSILKRIDELIYFYKIRSEIPRRRDNAGIGQIPAVGDHVLPASLFFEGYERPHQTLLQRGIHVFTGNGTGGKGGHFELVIISLFHFFN